MTCAPPTCLKTGHPTTAPANDGTSPARPFALPATELPTAESPAAEAPLVDALILALEHSAEGFILLDGDDRLRHANGRAKTLMPDLAELLVPGTAFEALVRRAALADGAAASALAGTPAGDPEGEARREGWVQSRLAHHRRSGEPMTVPTTDGRWLQIVEHPVGDGLLIVYTDVTTARRAEERLRTRDAETRAARREAESANRAKSEFLAQMSHELRTPLNAVLGFSELLMSEAFGPLGSARYLSYAGDIRDAGARLLGLIDDILDLASIEAGRMPMSDEGLDLEVLTLRAAALRQGDATAGGIALRREVPAGLPLLLADARAVEQMLDNLLANAIAFTPPGGTAILTASRTPDGGIALMVADTGVGIPAAELARVMNPFERVDSSIARDSTGAGLGLPIVKRLAEMHGGRLDLTSETGTGTSAVLVFPASRSLPRGPCAPLPLSPLSQR